MSIGLQILRGSRSGETVTLEDGQPLSVGTGDACALRLDDLGLNPVQFSVEPDRAGWALVHGGGTPPTLINRQPVECSPVRAGDLIQAGRGLFAVVAVPEAMSARNPLEETNPTYRERRVLDPRAMGSAADHGRALAALETLNRLGYELHSRRGVDGLLTQVAEAALELVPSAERAVAVLERGGEFEVVASSARGGDAGSLRVSRTILDQSVRHGMSTISADASADVRFAKATSVRDGFLRSVICVPLVGRSRNRGGLYVDAGQPEAFTGSDLEWLALLGLQGGAALERALLEQSLREREEQARELATALARQKSYLETVLAETRDGILLLDDGGRPLIVNRALRELVGQGNFGSTEELLGLLATLRPDPEDAFARALGVGAREEEVSDLPCQLSWPKARALLLTGTTVLTEGGALGRLVILRRAG